MKADKNPAFQRWDYSHKPFWKPKGCNDKYGKSGYNKHVRDGSPVCQRCRNSMNHYRRELARGQGSPRRLQPCGTPAAAHRHRQKGEPVDFACKVAEANYRAELRNS